MQRIGRTKTVSALTGQWTFNNGVSSSLMAKSVEAKEGVVRHLVLLHLV
jgi:hypothetical protein